MLVSLLIVFSVDPVHIFKDSNIVVRTDEPTSIIAFTLE